MYVRQPICSVKCHYTSAIAYRQVIVREGKVKLDDIITPRMPLSEGTKAYDMFKKKTDDCVKVVLKP